MLYDKNRNNPQLDKELFKNPTAEYRGTPFWAWNCELDEKELPILQIVPEENETPAIPIN